MYIFFMPRPWGLEALATLSMFSLQVNWSNPDQLVPPHQHWGGVYVWFIIVGVSLKVASPFSSLTSIIIKTLQNSKHVDTLIYKMCECVCEWHACVYILWNVLKKHVALNTTIFWPLITLFFFNHINKENCVRSKQTDKSRGIKSACQCEQSACWKTNIEQSQMDFPFS